MKKLLASVTDKPRLLDYALLILLFPFSHYLISLRERDTIYERLQNPYYWVALAFTYGCGALVVQYVRRQNRRLNHSYGVDDDWDQRIIQHLKWNVAAPVLTVVLLVTFYFAAFGENIIARRYFVNELPIVAGAIFVLAILYLGLDLLTYFRHRENERMAFERFKSERGTLVWNNGALPVVDKLGLKRMIAPQEVGLLQRHNRKTYVYTMDGHLYTVLLPRDELEVWVAANGAFQASQWFFVMPWGIAAEPVSTTKGMNFPLVPTISIGNERGIVLVKADIAAAWVCVSKKRVATGRKWYGELVYKEGARNMRPLSR